MKIPSSTKDLLDKLGSQGIYLTIDELQCLIDDLMNHFLIEVYTTYEGSVLNSMELEKYDRQLNFMTSMGMNIGDSFSAQESLKQKHVVILGIGGVGSHASYALSVMGIGELTIIDQDIIELSNTSRQMLFDERDIGRLKVEVAREKLSKYNSHLKINTVNQSIRSSEDIIHIMEDKKVDLLILAADTPRGEIQYICDQACDKLSIPFIHGGPAGGFVFVGPFIIPGNTKSLSQLIKTKYTLAEGFTGINDGFIASIIEPYNAMAANLIVLEVFKFFTGMGSVKSINKRIMINLTDMTILTEDYGD